MVEVIESCGRAIRGRLKGRLRLLGDLGEGCQLGGLADGDFR